MMFARCMSALAVSLVAACGGSASPEDAGADDASSGSDAGVVDRGPTRLALEGDPNGLFWDESDGRLLVADDNGNRILTWTDAGGFTLVADLPAVGGSGAGLGQVVRMGDGTLVVTRFGFGTAGDVVYLREGESPQIVPGLDVERRRIGLTVAPDGALFDSWFVRVASGDRVGAVGALGLDGTEPELITGLVKPVGVLATDADLYIADQDLGQILRAPRATPTELEVVAEVESPDLIAFGSAGAIFTGTVGGQVVRVDAAGAVSIVAGGFQQVRGVAFDPAGRRLFVADHDPDEADGVEHAIHIVPVD